MKRDLLLLSDLTAAEIEALLAKAIAFKRNRHAINPSLKGRILGLIFEKSSTRTRVSFESAMVRLGGYAISLEAGSMQISRGETYADTARVLSRYVDGLVLRTYTQEAVEEMARYSSVPVINGLTDLSHPCQLLADLMTLTERWGSMKGRKVAYIGDGNNMAHSWIEAAMLLGFELRVATPKGYEPEAQVRKSAAKVSNIYFSNDPRQAVKDADAVNVDTWFSMGQKVSAAKKKAFKPFQLNAKLAGLLAPNGFVLHCLPAHRGEEITDEVLDGPRSIVFDEAENRMWAQMALLETLLK